MLFCGTSSANDDVLDVSQIVLADYVVKYGSLEGLYRVMVLQWLNKPSQDLRCCARGLLNN